MSVYIPTRKAIDALNGNLERYCRKCGQRVDLTGEDLLWFPDTDAFEHYTCPDPVTEAQT